MSWITHEARAKYGYKDEETKDGKFWNRVFDETKKCIALGEKSEDVSDSD